MGKDVTEDTKGLEKEIEKKIKESGNKPTKKTKTMVDSEGNLRTVETNKEIDEADKARDAAYEKYFKDKPVKKKAGGKVKMKKGGMVKKHRGDGCAQRGKTKGRMV